jgi:hypothetical protein
MAETANDLVLKCTGMARTGADFPSVWDAVLKGTRSCRRLTRSDS